MHFQDQFPRCHLHNKSPNIKTFFHELLEFSLNMQLLKVHIFINSFLSIFSFLLTLVCTLGFFSNLFSIITSFLHISIVSSLRLILFSSLKDSYIDNFQKNMSKANRKKKFYIEELIFDNEQMRTIYKQSKRFTNKVGKV